MNIPIEKSFLKIKTIFQEKFLLEEKAANTLGLDIGTFSVKMVQVSLEKSKISIVNFGISKIKNNNVSEAIKEVIRDSKLDTKLVNIGLFGQGVIVRHVLLPRMPIKELKQSIGTEADKYIPFPIESVLLDCHILKELPQENKMLVVIAAAKKDLIQERRKLLSSLNLIPNIIDVDCIVLANAFNELGSKAASNKVNNGKAKAVAVVNIGAHITCLGILQEGILKFSREIDIGGDNFSKRMANVFDLDFKAAEQLKCNPSEEERSKNLEVCSFLLNKLIHELRISFDYYETENNVPIGKIYLCGGSAHLEGIEGLLNNSLGVETEIWKPNSLEIKSGINADNFNSQFSELTVAIGLALR